MPDRTGPDLTWQAADRAVARAIAARHAALRRPVLVGLAGAQGSGKSTMAPRLAALLAELELRTAVLALDDFYLTRAERAALAREIHPLLATRGVPGTHDTALLAAALDALLAGRMARVPCFDKAADDRAGARDLAGPFDVVLLEGWCVGAQPETAAELAEPINALERDDDPDGSWRSWVNARLAGDYAALFARIELRVMLRAPDFGVVERWRGEQEAQLGEAGMGRERIARFVAHYERITRRMLVDAPADLVIDLDRDRRPVF
ncbi:kinase [Tsuneonella sp. YG55]|uniref:Kinase n=1 Tax=Tsuneonella litorea TaxID=2976475 RepID=A0A9X3ANN3_9SPHN|nr:kinase [Tsuneonella litorea]MCT2559982.1 kinase [Tsuneonella litorea]